MGHMFFRSWGSVGTGGLQELWQRAGLGVYPQRGLGERRFREGRETLRTDVTS